MIGEIRVDWDDPNSPIIEACTTADLLDNARTARQDYSINGWPGSRGAKPHQII